MSIFAVSALLLAAPGIVASQRPQEFGIRMACGARPRNILSLAHRSDLFGVSSNDATTFAVVPVVLGVVSLVACFIPARRATRVSPTQTLKQ